MANSASRPNTSNLVQVLRALLIFVMVMLAMSGVHVSQPQPLPNNSGGPATTTMVGVTVGTTFYTPTEEISNLKSTYPQVNQTTFYCSTQTDCVDVRTQACFHNSPADQACINKTYSAAYYASRNRTIGSGIRICPLYMIAAEVSCACINQGCSLVYTAT